MKMKKYLALTMVFCMVFSTVLPVGATGDATHSCDDPACTVCNPQAPQQPETLPAPVHTEGCQDGCTAEGCQCSCHGESETPEVPETPEEPEVPEEPSHIEGCQDGCTAEDCLCPCHGQPEEPQGPLFGGMTADELVGALLSASSLSDFDALLDTLSEQELSDFAAAIDAQQLEAIDAHAAELTLAYESQDSSEVPAGEGVETKPVHGEDYSSSAPSETVDVTDAAPFVPPVKTSSPMNKSSVARARTMAPQITPLGGPAEEEDDLKLDKTVSGSEEDGYILTLQSYANGEVKIDSTETTVPADIVLVIDQSGSMAEDFTSIVFNPAGNLTAEQLYENDENYYVLASDGRYVLVTIQRKTETLESYTSCAGWDNESLYSSRNSIYHKHSDDTYHSVSIRRSGLGILRREYTYTCQTCGRLGSSDRDDNVPSFASSLYLRPTETTYTFSYFDNGEIVSATVSADYPSGPDGWTFYTARSGGQTTRLDALTDAVEQFVSQVEQKTLGPDGIAGTEDDVNHRIAIVGFSSDGYDNTELLTGVSITRGEWKGSDPSASDYYGYYYYPTGYEMNGVQYGSISTSQYTAALQDVSTSSGRTSIANAIGALTAKGGTYTDDGLDMAKNIFQYDNYSGTEERSRVVIVFTDGQPGLSSSDGFTSSIANNAIDSAKILKAPVSDNPWSTGYGATVYSIGIFDGADGNTPAPESGGRDTQKANRFMHLLSSNYPDAQSMNQSGSLASLKPGQSYYLSASDSSALNNIFQTISDEIESGGTSVALDEHAVTKDVIAQSFELPEGTTENDINAYIVDYAGNGTWEDRSGWQAVSTSDISISADRRTVSVTGFDYSKNYVWDNSAASPAFGGQKLVIEIPIVVREGFWGGNDVPTNERSSGIYATADSQEAYRSFPVPHVNVSMHPSIAAADKSIYLSQSVSDEDLFTLPGVTEPWQIEYVNLSAVPNTPVNTTPTSDAQYTFTFTVSPLTDGSSSLGTPNGMQGITSQDTANVWVFTPTVTFRDTRREVGSDLTGFTHSPQSVSWNHQGSAPRPQGSAPALDFRYVLDGGVTVMPSVSVGVNAEVLIGGRDYTQYATFGWEMGGDGCHCTQAPAGFEFIIHTDTVSLTITKKVTGKIEQSFLFHIVKNDGSFETTVMLMPEHFTGGTASVTISGLTPGAYTVTEDTAWSWRYECANPVQNVNVGEVFTVTFENEHSNNNWLGGDASAENDFNPPAVSLMGQPSLPPEEQKENEGGAQA